MKLKWREMGSGLVVPIILIAVWQFVTAMEWVNPQVLPSPWAVLKKWLEYASPLTPYDPAAGSWMMWVFSGELLRDTMGTMYRVIIGFVVGAGLALPLGLVMGSSSRVYAWFNPLLQVLRPIPPIAYIPLSILWFGLGNPPAIFLILSISLFLIDHLLPSDCIMSSNHPVPRPARFFGNFFFFLFPLRFCLFF